MAASTEIRKEVADYTDTLKTIGLYDKEHQAKINTFYDNPNPEERFIVHREYGGNRVSFELSPVVINGKMELANYAVLLPARHPLPKHFASNGIDSRELDARMQQIDWKNHPGNFFDNMGEVSPEKKAMDEVLNDLIRFTDIKVKNHPDLWIKVNDMADALMNKHFSGTPLEEALIGTVPYLRPAFHHYVPFPPYLHSSIPGSMAHDASEVNKLSQLAYSEDYKNRRTMNLNNLQDRKDEMKNLGFSKETIDKMEELIRKDSPSFKLYESAPATKGQIDYIIPIKKSALSDFYYLNKYEVTHNLAKPLAEGEKYMVITPQDDGKNLVRKLETMTEAIDYFKEQKGNSELAVGKDARSKTTLAKMENGKVNFVEKDFQRTFRQPPIPQTFYLDEGQGFTKEQAGNLVQGRAVYRDDLLSSQGVPFKAWTMLNVDKPRDRYNNYPLRYYHDPAYQFDLKAELSQYNIRDMENPKTAEKIETALRNGNRAYAVVENKNGEPFDMYIEAAVRWRKTNFYHLDGKSEKREEFLKPGVQQDKVFEWNIQQNNKQEQSRGMGVGR